MDLVSKPSLSKPQDRRVGKDDIDILMDALRHSKVTYLKLLILIAIETGLRQGELVKLMWCDVDLANVDDSGSTFAFTGVLKLS